MRKIGIRILPFSVVLYIIAYLDRANVAFAKLTMSAELGLSEAVFGFGAGLFFLGYFFLEIPGALIVERWSARLLLARILVTWGIFSMLQAFVQTPLQFYTVRFLLGAAEAGFFPGLIVYFTHWFPGEYRARALAGFILAIPLSLVLGGSYLRAAIERGLVRHLRMALGIYCRRNSSGRVRSHHSMVPDGPASSGNLARPR